jgi:hypothetical protein
MQGKRCKTNNYVLCFISTNVLILRQNVKSQNQIVPFANLDLHQSLFAAIYKLPFS